MQGNHNRKSIRCTDEPRKLAGFLLWLKGYGKYVYPKETLDEMDELFRRELDKYFPGAKVEYLV